MSDFLPGLACGAILAGILAILIPGPNTTPKEIEWAQTVCASNGGILAVRASPRLSARTRAWCGNGAFFIKQATP